MYYSTEAHYSVVDTHFLCYNLYRNYYKKCVVSFKEMRRQGVGRHEGEGVRLAGTEGMNRTTLLGSGQICLLNVL